MHLNETNYNIDNLQYIDINVNGLIRRKREVEDDGDVEVEPPQYAPVSLAEASEAVNEAATTPYRHHPMSHHHPHSAD